MVWLVHQRPEGLGEAHPMLILLRLGHWETPGQGLVPLMLPTHPQAWSGLELVDVAEEGLVVDEVSEAEGVEGHERGGEGGKARTGA